MARPIKNTPNFVCPRCTTLRQSFGNRNSIHSFEPCLPPVKTTAKKPAFFVCYNNYYLCRHKNSKTMSIIMRGTGAYKGDEGEILKRSGIVYK
jgi:hypothetical protein